MLGILMSNIFHKIRKLNKDKFIQDKHCASFDVCVVSEIFNMITHKKQEEFLIEGWSSADGIPFKERSGSEYVVVMLFNKEVGEVWGHIERDTFQVLCKKLDLVTE